MKDLILKRDIVIPAGTVFRAGPKSVSYGDGVVVADVAVSNDATITVTGFTPDDDFDELLQEAE